MFKPRAIVTRRRRAHVLAATLTASLALSACAAADGGAVGQAGFGGPGPTRRMKIPSLRSNEYRLSWGLGVVNAYPAYAAGATGRGVVVALIDVGLEGAQPEVVANLSPASTDLVAARDPASPASRHGGYVAGTLASALNGSGVLGVAYDATVLSIRAELDGRCRVDDCTLAASDLAKGIDYALARGARVIALAVQGQRRLSARFEEALGRARDAGAVVIVAAGNGSDGETAWPARYAADPRFAETVIAVGAVDSEGRMTPWSNRAGGAKDAYLLAPGRRVVTDCDDKYCRLVSGTSFAVPFVAGAVALVMQAHPDLSARQASRLVLAAGRDMGARGPDPVFGQGLLDIGRAMRLARQQTARPKL